MDGIRWKDNLKSVFLKYRYAILILVLGLLLMLWPGSDRTQATESSPEIPASTNDLQEELAAILSQIQGVGKVQLLLTQQRGPETLYQQDEDMDSDSDSSSSRRDTVILTDQTRAETGLVRQVLPPVYLGAVVVCQGGDQPQVQLAVVEAVCAATGLTADKVTVLKMK
jgi:stage III sporulation protein AG